MMSTCLLSLDWACLLSCGDVAAEHAAVRLHAAHTVLAMLAYESRGEDERHVMSNRSRVLIHGMADYILHAGREHASKATGGLYMPGLHDGFAARVPST